MRSMNAAISGLIAAQQNAVLSQISFSVQGKRLDAAEQQGQAVVELIDKAAEIPEGGAGQGRAGR